MSSSTTLDAMCSANVQEPETVLSPSLSAALVPTAPPSTLPSKVRKSAMLTLELRQDHKFGYSIPAEKVRVIKECITNYLRELASGEVGVSFKIDNSVKVMEDFLVIRNRALKGDDGSDEPNQLNITMNTENIDGTKFHHILMVHHKDGKVKTECPYISNFVEGLEHDEYDPDTAQVLTAVYTMYEFFAPKEIDFVVRYPDGCTSSDRFSVHGDFEEISKMRRKVNAFCKEWVANKCEEAVGGKSVKVKKVRKGPY